MGCRFPLTCSSEYRSLGLAPQHTTLQRGPPRSGPAACGDMGTCHFCNPSGRTSGRGAGAGAGPGGAADEEGEADQGAGLPL